MSPKLPIELKPPNHQFIQGIKEGLSFKNKTNKKIEKNKRETTVYSFYKIYLFLGYIPKILKIDTPTLQGKLFVHRIKNGFTYSEIAKQIGLDKSTIIRFEKNGDVKVETIKKIKLHLRKENILRVT